MSRCTVGKLCHVNTRSGWQRSIRVHKRMVSIVHQTAEHFYTSQRLLFASDSIINIEICLPKHWQD